MNLLVQLCVLPSLTGWRLFFTLQPDAFETFHGTTIDSSIMWDAALSELRKWKQVVKISERQILQRSDWDDLEDESVMCGH